MKIAILGYDVEGRASYEYFASLGHQLTICDQKPDREIPEGATAILGEQYLDNLEQFDLLVRTPGLRPDKILAKNPTVAGKITSHINEFLRVCPTKNVIGVTGTKGKGTTTTLIAKMLEAVGKKVKLGGNIGTPPLSFLAELTPEIWVVLELSSFQLIDIKTSPHIAVCLMVTPEHLDWHTGANEYITAKQQLFVHQNLGDMAIYFEDSEASQTIASVGAGQKIPYFADPGAFVQNGQFVIDEKIICRTDKLKLLGQHNWQNACAAITAVWQIAQNVDAIRSVLTTFAGLPHRLEFVRKVDGVRYYNDSYATSPEATIAALKSIAQPKVMIMGGFDRNLDLIHLAKIFANHQDTIRRVLLIGASAPRVASELEKQSFRNFEVLPAKTMSEIVAAARATAQPGDTIVLSPGFASFDMFKNFEDRGNQYQEAVNQL